MPWPSPPLRAAAVGEPDDVARDGIRVSSVDPKSIPSALHAMFLPMPSTRMGLATEHQPS
jgi:hypothetical protein